MNTPKIILLTIVLAFFSVQSAADSQYSANYEIELKTNQNASSIRTRSAFNKGEAIEHQLGNYRVVMTVKEQSAKDYILNVIVENSSTTEIESSILDQDFSGNYGGILEFESQNHDLSLSGAIIVGSFKSD